MRKGLALQATLLRFGWRAALGQILSSEKGTGTRIFRLFFFAYFPIWMLWTHYHAFEKVSNPRHVAELMKSWKLPVCPDASCERLLQSSMVWPDFLQLFWLGTVVALCGALFAAIFAAAGATKPENTDRELDWIRTFPINMRSFLWGQLLHRTVFNHNLWFIFLPFVLGFLLARAQNLATILPIALVMALATTLMTTSLGMMLNYLARSKLSSRGQRNFRTISAIFAIVPLIFYLTLVAESRSYWVLLMEHAAHFQDAWLTRQLQDLLMAKSFAYPSMLALLAMCTVTASLNILVMERILRRDVIQATGSGQTDSKLLRPTLDTLPLMMRRQILHLLRDHYHLANVIMAPLLLLMIFLIDRVGNTDLLGPVGSLFFLTLVSASGMGYASIKLVTKEKDALWFYASTPRLLTDIFREQQRFYLIVGILAFLIFSGFLLPAAAFQDPIFALRFGLILIFLYLYESHNRNMALTSYHPDGGTATIPVRQLFMLLPIGPILAFGLALGNIWLLTTQFLLYSALVYGYYEKARLAEVGLEDPMNNKLVPLALADGLIVAFVYAALINAANGLSYLLLFRVPTVATWPTFIISLLVFIGLQVQNRSRQATDLPVYHGKISKANFALLTAGAAVAAAGTGLWLRMTAGWEGFDHIYYRLEEFSSPVALTIAAALSTIVIEEYIFRGLIQRGLERRQGFALAWIVSAFLTSLCHKPQDFGPVLLTSLASGLLYHRTKILWPGILLGLGVQVIRWLWL